MIKRRNPELDLWEGQPIERDPEARSEHHIQTHFMVLVKDRLAEYPELWGMHATPNGGKRQYMTAALLKAEGVKAGYPDISLDVPRVPYHGWRCEFKYADNRPSPEQEEWLAYLRAQGYYVTVKWSAMAALRDVLSYLDHGRTELLRGVFTLPHSAACGVEYRGCAPDCPKALAERAAPLHSKPELEKITP
jgi:hypothetical protein